MVHAISSWAGLHVVSDVVLFVVIVVAMGGVAIAAFLWCYFYPMIQRRHDAGTATAHNVKRPVLASARSLFGLRPRTPPPTAPQLLARYGRLDMRIARPPPALSHFRGSPHSPSLSSSCSSSPSCLGTPHVWSHSTLPEVIVTPVDMGILGRTVESRTTPKKGGDHYDSCKREDG